MNEMKESDNFSSDIKSFIKEADLLVMNIFFALVLSFSS